jgi:hypothetical protein
MTQQPLPLMTEELLTPPTPTCFRFPDEPTWIAAGLAAGIYVKEPVLDDDGNETGEELKLVGYTHSYACDVIGTISRGGEWDEDGNEITPPKVLEGWHVNYLGVVPDEWLKYAVWPKSSARVWA